MGTWPKGIKVKNKQIKTGWLGESYATKKQKKNQEEELEWDNAFNTC